MQTVRKWTKAEPTINDDELAKRVDDFFRYCERTNEYPSVEKLALACGVTRSTLWRWKTEPGACSPVRQQIIEKAYDVLAAIDAELVATGISPISTYSFRAKNYYGMKDQAETIVIDRNTPLLADGKSLEELKDRYLNTGSRAQKALSVQEAEVVPKEEQKTDEHTEKESASQNA